MTTRTAARHKVMLRRALRAKPGERKPALFVSIVTDYNGGGARLQWGHVEPLDPAVYPRFKVLARFACYPVNEGGTVPEIAPPAVAWPFPVSAHEES